MAVASTNAWKVDVEETIQSAIRSQFKASLPLFRSKDFQQRGNQFAILQGDDSISNNNMFTRLSDTYNLTLNFYMVDHKRNDSTIKKFFKTVSRLEEGLYSFLEINPLFNIEVSTITYEDDNDFNGYRKAQFALVVRNVR